MSHVSQALKMQREAQRKRLLAPSNDPVRRDFDRQWADGLEMDAQAPLTPDQPLVHGAGDRDSPTSINGPTRAGIDHQRA
jgi:hypothetical protein